MKKLNLGSGDFPKEGYVNVDFYSNVTSDLVHDLNTFPYPLADEDFDLVEADHCLEHLDRPFLVMKEIHRICKPGAKVVIRVPHFSRGFTHPEHKSGFDISFPYYFIKGYPGGYQGFEFKCTRMKFSWFAQPYMKKNVLPAFSFYTATLLGYWFNFWANLWPSFCSRAWCYWVGGFEQIEFEFKVIK